MTPQLGKNSPPFVETEAPLPCLQRIATDSYPDLGEVSSNVYIFKVHFKIILPSNSTSLKQPSFNLISLYLKSKQRFTRSSGLLSVCVCLCILLHLSVCLLSGLWDHLVATGSVPPQFFFLFLCGLCHIKESGGLLLPRTICSFIYSD